MQEAQKQLNVHGEIIGLHTGVWGNFRNITGNVAGISGRVSLRLSGNVNRIHGDVSGLIGNVNKIWGNVNNIFGNLDRSALNGDVSNCYGDVRHWLDTDNSAPRNLHHTPDGRVTTVTDYEFERLLEPTVEDITEDLEREQRLIEEHQDKVARRMAKQARASTKR